jgi:hypothetical protein
LPVAGGFLGSLGLVLAGRIDLVSGIPGGGGWPRPLYHYSLVLYGGMSGVLYLLATRLMRPVRRWRFARQEILRMAAAALLFVAAVAVGFIATAGRYEWRQGAVGGLQPTPAPAMVIPVAPSVARRVVAVGEVSAEAAPPSPLPTPTPNTILAAGDEAGIYAAAVRQLYTVDHTFGDQPPNFPVVYLIQWTDDGVGDPEAPRSEPHLLPPAIQEAIVGALADLPADLIWVDSKDEVPLEGNGGQVKGGGAVITMGNIYVQDDGSAHVSVSIYFGSTGGAGKTYVLQQIDGAWQVVGTTGVEWIS